MYRITDLFLTTFLTKPTYITTIYHITRNVLTTIQAHRTTTALSTTANISPTGWKTLVEYGATEILYYLWVDT